MNTTNLYRNSGNVKIEGIDTDRLSLSDLKNRHCGERAFVIGNGPSLHIKDLDKLENEITFACNRIYLAFGETAWRPTYYTVEDHLVAKQSQKEIEDMSGTVKFFPNTLASHGIKFSNSIEYPFIWKDVFPELPSFSSNAENGLYWGSTVAYTMIQMACYMGIREIYLLGIDLVFTVSSQWVAKTGKFKIYVCEGEQNHFHPDYRKKGEQYHQPNLDYAEKTFLSVKQHAEKNGIKIFNASNGGKLGIFPRKDLNTVLED